MSLGRIRYNLLLVVLAGNCLSKGISHHPSIRWTNNQEFSTFLSQKANGYNDEPYWLNDLKQSVFKAIILEQLDNDDTYSAISDAPYFGRPSRSVQFGDIVTLATGELGEDASGELIFCQHEYEGGSHICSDIMSQHLFRWKVTRIRHHGAGKTFHYDLRFTIEPTKIWSNRRITGTGIQSKINSMTNLGHLVTRMRSVRDYSMQSDYSDRDYNKARDKYVKKFTNLYKPGFILKIDTNEVKHVLYNLPQISQTKPGRLVFEDRAYPSQHRKAVEHKNLYIPIKHDNSNRNIMQSLTGVNIGFANVINCSKTCIDKSVNMKTQDLANHTHTTTTALPAYEYTTEISVLETTSKSSPLFSEKPKFNVTMITSDSEEQKNIQLERNSTVENSTENSGMN